jgi:hypothetical protein
MPIEELAGIQEYESQNKPQENIYANATWKKNLKVQEQYEKKWEKNRLKRLTSTLNYVNTNISVPYVNPNEKVLNMRLVRDNNVYYYSKNMTLQNDQKHLFNYFHLEDQQPPYKLQPYSTYFSSTRF